MVYKLDGGTVIDAEGNLVIENLYSTAIILKTQAQGIVGGYISGGSPPNTTSNVIEKFSFSSDGNSSDVGDLTVGRVYVNGTSSSSNGYTHGGSSNPPYVSGTDIIDKFPFSVDANATDVGDLLAVIIQTSGQSSATHGYVSGGGGSPATVNVIQKYPFSSDANSTDVGDLLGNRENGSGTSSSASGYNSGGYSSPPYVSSYNVIEKFTFSSDANSTDVGDMIVSRSSTAGQQV